MWDAEGIKEQEPCPNCQSTNTISYHYEEGFTELECETCGFHSDAPELSDLARYTGELKEKKQLFVMPVKKLKA